MMSELNVDCGPADKDGFRTVVARCGEQAHQDQFHPKDAVRRLWFAASALKKFGRPVTSEALSQLAAMVLQKTSGRNGGAARRNIQARVTRLSDVPPREVEWLWPGRVALGTITLLAGDPGLGKSFVTLDMAARVSRGAAWPDEAAGITNDEARMTNESKFDIRHSEFFHSDPASVVLLSAEDDLARTIRPRLEGLGADCTRIVTLQAVDVTDGDRETARPFELGRDLEQLAAAVEQLDDCRLVVIDPVSAYLGHTGEHFNAGVRGLLAPLAELANQRNLAMVLVTHLRKEEGAMIHRTIGSMAFVAAARVAWIVTRDRYESSRRLMLPVKNNLAPDVGGLAYTIEPVGFASAPVVCWEAGRVEVPADCAMNESRRPANRPGEERQQVVEWLREYLADGPKLAVEVRQAAEAHGFSLGTLRRAFRALGGEVVKSSGEAHGGWHWQLPSDGMQDDQKSDPVVLSALGGQDAQLPGAGVVSALGALTPIA